MTTSRNEAVWGGCCDLYFRRFYRGSKVVEDDVEDVRLKTNLYFALASFHLVGYVNSDYKTDTGIQHHNFSYLDLSKRNRDIEC